jgi:nucleotide-binding universal stress UspA family protein
MLFFAYDGSINGDWVSHYAIQLAAADPDARLRLLHVRDSTLAEVMLAEKLQRMAAECARQGVELSPLIVPRCSGGVLAALRQAVPTGPAHDLICGIPVRAHRYGLLADSIPEQLMRIGHCNVLAIRVVTPGMLGVPRRLLLPVAEGSGGLRLGLPFLRLFAPQVSHLHIVLIRRVARWRLRWLSPEQFDQLHLDGQAHCARVEQAITDALGLEDKVMDAQVVVSDSVAREILIAATRTKSRLIYMERCERGPRERLVRADPLEQVLGAATCDVAVYRRSDW